MSWEEIGYGWVGGSLFDDESTACLQKNSLKYLGPTEVSIQYDLAYSGMIEFEIGGSYPFLGQCQS